MTYVDDVVVDALQREQNRIEVALADRRNGLQARADRLRIAADAAQAELSGAQVKLDAIKAKLRDLRP